MENRNVEIDTIVEISKDPKETIVAEPLMYYKHVSANQPFKFEKLEVESISEALALALNYKLI